MADIAGMNKIGCSSDFTYAQLNNNQLLDDAEIVYTEQLQAADDVDEGASNVATDESPSNAVVAAESAVNVGSNIAVETQYVMHQPAYQRGSQYVRYNEFDDDKNEDETGDDDGSSNETPDIEIDDENDKSWEPSMK